jgi:hypothetical protein
MQELLRIGVDDRNEILCKFFLRCEVFEEVASITYHWMSIQVFMLRESSKDKRLLYPSASREALVITDGPSVTEDLIRGYT